MTDRGPDGKFVKGNKASPGRKPRATEQEYRDSIKEVIPLQRFIWQLEKLAARADRGDSRAFDKICDLLGLNVIKNEHTGENGSAITIRIIDEDTEPGSDG
jgi:hypothetical protein